MENYQNVLNNLERAYGAAKAEEFSQHVFCLFWDGKVDSPIEQVFYCASIFISIFEFIEPEHCFDPNGKMATLGLQIRPQVSFPPYRVDFVLTYRRNFDSLEKTVIVECDSQQFHDRSEPERRYEKERDRFLQKNGYKVFRFTGKEILDKPIQSAAEVIEFLTDNPIDLERYGQN